MALTSEERLHLENALEQIDSAEKAGSALRYSYANRPLLENARAYTEADWEHWDALTARFARTADILTQRVFRALDLVEFYPPGSTFLDRLHRAEKRGHIESTYQWKEIREIRNQIAHEYATAALIPLFEDVVKYTPALLQTVERLLKYRRALAERLAERDETQ